MCVDEVSGIRVVDVEDVPIAIAPTNVQFSGNYAIKITWNDRHDTGLFTWEYLELLCQDLAAVVGQVSNLPANPTNGT